MNGSEWKRAEESGGEWILELYPQRLVWCDRTSYASGPPAPTSFVVLAVLCRMDITEKMLEICRNGAERRRVQNIIKTKK